MDEETKQIVRDLALVLLGVTVVIQFSFISALVEQSQNNYEDIRRHSTILDRQNDSIEYNQGRIEENYDNIMENGGEMLLLKDDLEEALGENWRLRPHQLKSGRFNTSYWYNTTDLTAGDGK
jgi:hypothetical protein